MEKDKVETLLGFAVKAGKFLYGVDAISEYRKKIHLLITDNTLAKSGRNELNKVSALRKIPILICKKPINEILHKMNCKAVALRDFQMANAILNNLNGNYQLIESPEVKI